MRFKRWVHITVARWLTHDRSPLNFFFILENSFLPSVVIARHSLQFSTQTQWNHVRLTWRLGSKAANLAIQSSEPEVIVTCRKVQTTILSAANAFTSVISNWVDLNDLPGKNTVSIEWFIPPPFKAKVRRKPGKRIFQTLLKKSAIKAHYQNWWRSFITIS